MQIDGTIFKKEKSRLGFGGTTTYHIQLHNRKDKMEVVCPNDLMNFDEGENVNITMNGSKRVQ